MKIKHTCNKCFAETGEKIEMKQHKTKKKYFHCEKCNGWYECWLPITEAQQRRAIERAKEKGYY